ncbi:TMhelix containing protein [Vibrio phage 1.079.O._10N.286.45.E9]|nr:TMhelix containing protein [Vibrio phage 1.079.O._10N.286.45.E9]
MSVKDFVFMVFSLIISVVNGIVVGTGAAINFRGTFVQEFFGIDSTVCGFVIGILFFIVTFKFMKDSLFGFKFYNEKPQSRG